jgi:GLPGLI family protein
MHTSSKKILITIETNQTRYYYCGYVCKKATVNYAGRDWSAWYNPDIPTVG